MQERRRRLSGLAAELPEEEDGLVTREPHLRSAGDARDLQWCSSRGSGAITERSRVLCRSVSRRELEAFAGGLAQVIAELRGHLDSRLGEHSERARS
jgi:hypothetical protein